MGMPKMLGRPYHSDSRSPPLPAHQLHQFSRYLHITSWILEQGNSNYFLALFTIVRFLWERIHFAALRPSVHTDTLSVFLKKYRFENALESGSKRKRIHIALVWISEDGRKRIKMKTITENISGTFVCSMLTEFNLHHNVYLSPKLGRIQQKKCIIHSWTSRWFLLFYSPKSLAARYEFL